ncbi:radical SAM protein [Anaeroselena agilis]|uniref:Radical SAM protein n=1 Tax=Anaeroselena agilis TaxID=3063788 RepID=A0ABU3NSK7_9FIRM|nr:radical SAM protein [Selenomonadales bacterium 4137-cl]
MDKGIARIVYKALDGGEITAAEIKKLLGVAWLSEEGFLLQYASRKMSEATARGKAEVHGQVGIDIGPCPKNCEYCSFAAKHSVFPAAKVHPLAEIIETCQGLEAAGANAVYLMATAAVALPEYIRYAREVRAALKPETPLVANIDDFDEEGAKALRKAGIAGIYHCVRIGEGKVTAIDPQVRVRTIKAAKKAGLLLGTSVGPVGPEHSVEEVAATTVLTRELKPVNNAACRRINIPGLPLSAHGSVSYARMAHILAVVRLANGYDIIGFGTHEPNGMGAMAGANLFWAERGANPRDTSEATVRGWTVEQARALLEEAGWEALTGPSVMFGGR